MATEASALESREFSMENSSEYPPILLPPPNGVKSGGDSTRLKICEGCGRSKPKGVQPTCAHAARGPVILLSPPHRPTKPVVPDVDDHDRAASVMPWWTRRWPTRQVEPEESDNICHGRERALADAIRARGNPRIKDWGRHNDPVLICGCGYLHSGYWHSTDGCVVAEERADVPRLMASWARLNAPELRWDNTERKARVARLLGEHVGNVRSIYAAVDETKILHRRWRRHVSEPDAFLARWARQTAGRLDRILVIGGEHAFNPRRHRDVRLRKRRDLKASRKWPRFDPTTLTPDGYKRWEAERFLDRALAHHTYGDECPWAAGSKGDRHGNDGGAPDHLRAAVAVLDDVLPSPQLADSTTISAQASAQELVPAGEVSQKSS
jgi:hypothetical protein